MPKQKRNAAPVLHYFYCELAGFRKHFSLSITSDRRSQREERFRVCDSFEIFGRVRAHRVVGGKAKQGFSAAELLLSETSLPLEAWQRGQEFERVRGIGAIFEVGKETLKGSISLPAGELSRLVPFFAANALKEFLFIVTDLKRGSGLITKFSVDSELTDDEDM